MFREAVLACWCLGLTSQEVRSEPVPTKHTGVVYSLSVLDTPESVGRDFAGDLYFAYHGQVASFQEVGGRLRLRRVSETGLEGSEARHVRFRNGVPSVKRGMSIWDADGKGNWTNSLRFSGRFSDFVPTFDGRWVLFNASDVNLQHSAQAVITDGSSRTPQVLIPWDQAMRATTSMSEFKLLYTVSNLVVPYQELIAFYGQVSGRLRLINPVKGSVQDLALPWSGTTGENPDKGKVTIEARVPKRLQVIPAPNDQLIFVWDQNLVGVDPETAASITKEKGRDYRALAVNLETGDKRDLQVPKGLEFPMYSPDGVTLASLSEVFSQGDAPKPKGHASDLGTENKDINSQP